ncbi:MAG: hypothetical protein WKF84_18420 [Pyrinomonadaceae bacterium]
MIALFPAVGVNPVGLAVLADAARRYPANDFTLGDSTFERQLNVGGFRFNASVPVSLNTHTAKFNFNLTESGSQIVSVRGNYQDDVFGRASRFPDTPAPNFLNNPKGIAANHTWTISNSLVNSFTYGLTREAFTDQGDSTANALSFRFVYSPVDFTRTLSRTTPVQNFTDDLSWTKGDHNIQFGTNLRVIRNNRTSFSSAYDNAIANPSFYEASGAVLSRPISGIAPDLPHLFAPPFRLSWGASRNIRRILTSPVTAAFCPLAKGPDVSSLPKNMTFMRKTSGKHLQISR